MMTLDESDARARSLGGLVEGVTERLGRFPLGILQLIFRYQHRQRLLQIRPFEDPELGYDDPPLRQ